MTYLLLYTCIIIHSGLISGKGPTFFSTFISSLYLVVQTSTTAGYGDLHPRDTTGSLLLLVFVLITSIVFFSYFISRFKYIASLLALTYSSIVSQAVEEMDDWLSIREKDAEKREIPHSKLITNNSHVIRKLINTYRSYIMHNFAVVHQNVFFSKLSYKHQQVITDNAYLSFVKQFSYLTKILGHRVMRRLFSTITTRMYARV